MAPFEGMRPNGTLFFYCPSHRWFMAESWTSPVQAVDVHATYPWTTDLVVRLEFVSLALQVFLRSGGEDDCLMLQGSTPDDFVRFHHLTDGDGHLFTEVNARIDQRCSVCQTRPLSDRAQGVLVDLGFAPPDDWTTYESESLPSIPGQLAAVTETVFRDALDLPADYGIVARFKQPAMAQTFYLEWTFNRTH